MAAEDGTVPTGISPHKVDTADKVFPKPRRAPIVHIPLGVLGMDRRGMPILADMLYLVLLHHAKPLMQVHDCHRIKLSRLAHAAGFKSRNVAHLQATLRNLEKKTVNWNLLGAKQKWGTGGMFEWMEIHRDAAGLVVEYAYGPRMRELLDSVPYAPINLKTLKKISGKYGRRLYLLIKSAEYKGYLTIKIDNLRHTLGVPDRAHSAWAELRRKIIVSAVEAVHRVSDLRISFDLLPNEDRGEAALVAFRIRRSAEIQNNISSTGKTGGNTAVLWKMLYDLKAEMAELKMNKRRK